MKKHDPRNSARFAPLGMYVAVRDVEVIDEAAKIFRGKLVETNMPKDARMQQSMNLDEIIFSRNYQPDINEADKIYKEISFTDELLGVMFILVPKEKCLMMYQAGSSIIQIPVIQPTIHRQ